VAVLKETVIRRIEKGVVNKSRLPWPWAAEEGGPARKLCKEARELLCRRWRNNVLTKYDGGFITEMWVWERSLPKTTVNFPSNTASP